MPLLVWNEAMKLGIKRIDDQHQRWIALMNRLHEGIQHGLDKKLLDEAMTGMLDYTRTHFVDEEQLLRDYQYPGYAEHKKEHDGFIVRLHELQKEQENRDKNSWLLVLDVVKAMSKWLFDHIEYADRQFAPFLKEKGVQ